MAREEDLTLNLNVDDDDVDKLEHATDVVDELEGKKAEITVDADTDAAQQNIINLGDVTDEQAQRIQDRLSRVAPDLGDQFAAARDQADAALGQVADKTDEVAKAAEGAATSTDKMGKSAHVAGGEMSNMSGNAIGDLAKVAGLGDQAANSIGNVASNALEASGNLSLVAGAGVAGGLAMFAMSRAAEQTAKRTEDINKAMKELGRLSDEQAFNRFNEMLSEAVINGDNLDDVMDRLATTNLEGAKRVLDLSVAKEGENDLTRMLAKSIGDEEAARKQQIATNEKYKTSTDAASDATDAFTQATEEGAKKQQEMADKLKVVNDAADEVSDAFRDGTERIDALDRAFDKVNRGSALDFSEMASNTVQSFDDLKDAMGDVKDIGSKPLVPTTVASLRGLSDESAKVIDSIGSMRDAIQTELSSALETAGGNFDGFRDKAQFFREQITEQFTQVFEGMGLDSDTAKGKVNELLSALGLMPSQVETEIQVTKQEEAMKKIELFGAALDSLPPEVKAKVATELDENDPIAAWNTINTAIQDQGNVHVKTKVDDAQNMPAVLAKAQQQANQGVTVPVKLAVENAKKQIQGIFGGGSGSDSGRSVSQTINVNLPRGARSSDIARAINAHTRRSGRHYGAAVVTYARR